MSVECLWSRVDVYGDDVVTLLVLLSDYVLTRRGTYASRRYVIVVLCLCKKQGI